MRTATMCLTIFVALALAGCGDYKGPIRAFDGSVSTVTVDIDGHSTTYKKNDELPLGYLRSGEQEQYSTYSNSVDGGVVATGLAAEIAACADTENLAMCVAE